MSWLTERQLREFEATAKREPGIHVLSYPRILDAGGLTIGEMKRRGWAHLQDGRAGMFRHEDYRHAPSTSDPSNAPSTHETRAPAQAHERPDVPVHVPRVPR